MLRFALRGPLVRAKQATCFPRGLTSASTAMIAKVRPGEPSGGCLSTIVVDETSAPSGVLLDIASPEPPGSLSLPLSEFITGQKRRDNLMENCELQSAPATVPIFRPVSRTGETLYPRRVALFIYVKYRLLYIFYPPCNQLHRNEERRAILMLRRVVKEPG